MGHDDASMMAAALSYYAFISLFPLLLGLIAVLGIFLPSQTIQENLLDFVGKNLPASLDLVRQTINNVVDARGTLGLISILTLFFTGSRLFGTAAHAVNRTMRVKRERSFFIRQGRSIGMAFSVGLLFLLSFGITTGFSIASGLDLPFVNMLVQIGSYLLTFIITLSIFTLIYKFVPNAKMEWHSVWPGAVLAGLLFEAARHLFVFYIASFASYKLVYGSLGAVVILLIWIYYSSYILILGAEFNAELKHPHARLKMNKTSPENNSQ